ncbi:hypothetical protein H0H93_010026 [Arthromyces matolae]|nr:hypothetical protein H0H93_010026 [Arthromyces matolae]
MILEEVESRDNGQTLTNSNDVTSRDSRVFINAPPFFLNLPCALMLPLFAVRLATRRVVSAPLFSRGASVAYKFAPNALSRSFATTILRSEPTKTTAARTTKKPAAKKTVSKKSAKKPAKKAVKKKVVKAKKKVVKKKVPVKLVIPRGIKIPPRGLSTYLYFVTKVFESPLPKVTKENMIETAKLAANAWKALPESQKDDLNRIAAPLRAQASKERQDYINNLDFQILKELNRRRVAKGKTKLHRRIGSQAGRSLSGYMLWSSDYRKSPNVAGQRLTLSALGEAWRNCSPAEKQASNLFAFFFFSDLACFAFRLISLVPLP